MISVKVSHIEIVQSIQNAVNQPYDQTTTCLHAVGSGGVPLITGKTTYARVYFEDFAPANRIRANGTLEAVYIDDSSTERSLSVPGRGHVNRYPNVSPGLIEQRLDWQLSLNFEIPAGVTLTAGVKKFRLESLTDTVSGEDITIVDTDEAPNHISEVDFVTEKVLGCRALIFRYRDVENGVYLEPRREEVNAIRDYLERSFPLTRVDWSVIRLEAGRDFFALARASHYERDHDEMATRMLTRMLHQVMTHRNQELKAGFDEKTFYIGVFSDPGGRFGSVAVDAPQSPVPHIVAACATDTTGADGAHEIAHLLGRSHPGVPLLEVHGRDIGQHRIDKFALAEMGKDGHLSPPDKTADEEIYVGLDNNPSNHLPTVLAPGRNYDLMTYRDPRWLSAYSYREIYRRLACLAEENFYCNPERHWTVICSFDIDRKEGQILSVLPTDYRTPDKPANFASLEQFVVHHAVEQLDSQVAWLENNDKKNVDFWKLLKTIKPDFSQKIVEPKDASETDAAVAYTVSNYNGYLKNFIAKAIDDLKLTYKHVISRLTNNAIAIELYEPDIRIFANYAGEDGGPDCPEQDKQYMWQNGIDVYYRRVGSKDRFPFGLLQATVTSKPGTSEPPTSLTLMIDRVVVDKYAQSFETESKARKVAKAIFKLTDCLYAGDCVGVNLLPVGNGGDCEDRPRSNSLVYDIRKGGYYLNFHWPMAVLRQQPINERAATITTTIQCWRSSECIDSDTVDGKWETVCVTDQLRDQVWISPDLFEIEYDEECPPERPSAKRPERPLAARTQDVLKFRISITVGFYEFFSDQFGLGSAWYIATPELVRPKKEKRFKRRDSDLQCPDDFQYDDGSFSLIDDYTPA